MGYLRNILNIIECQWTLQFISSVREISGCFSLWWSFIAMFMKRWHLNDVSRQLVDRVIFLKKKLFSFVFAFYFSLYWFTFHWCFLPSGFYYPEDCIKIVIMWYERVKSEDSRILSEAIVALYFKFKPM